MFIKGSVIAAALALQAAATAVSSESPGWGVNGTPQCGCQTLRDNQVASVVDFVSSSIQGVIVPDVPRTSLESLVRSFAYGCTPASATGTCTAATPAWCWGSAFNGIVALCLPYGPYPGYPWPFHFSELENKGKSSKGGI